MSDKIVLTENITEKKKYVFWDMATSSLLWRKERMDENNKQQAVFKVIMEKR
ncbi:hypothetical protein [Porphyromonas macacae]|uniref:hypothetical protein n=1 Tax=Porphyromonas macacae TaxID=28115 RepID=UPI00037C9EC1|nr:hypothetical protein [Porphyromonas macacae]